MGPATRGGAGAAVPSPDTLPPALHTFTSETLSEPLSSRVLWRLHSAGGTKSLATSDDLSLLSAGQDLQN